VLQKYSLIALIFLLQLFTPGLRAQQVNFQNSLTNLGITNSTVYHSLQDSHGFIWFATESGAIRYDGTEYKHFTVDDGLSDNEILKVHADSKNRIWFLTLSGKLSYYLEGKFYNAGNSELIRKTSINSAFTSFYEDSQHNLWFGALDNIFLKLTPDNQVFRYDFGGALGGWECFFYEDKNQGQLVISTNGFFQVNGPKATPLQFPFKLKSSRSYCYTPAGGLIFLAPEGIVFMQGSQQRLLIPARYLPSYDQLGYLYLDKHRNLWITSLGNGTYLFQNVFLKPTTYTQYLPGKIITGALQDNEDNLWFTTIDEGNFMMPANYLKIISLTTDQGLTTNKVYAVTKDKDNNIWLGMDKGNINVITPSSIKKININFRKDIYNRVKNIYEDSNQDIWCATDKGVVFLQKAKNYKPTVVQGTTGKDYPSKFVTESADKKEIYYVYSSGIEKIKRENIKKEVYTSETLPALPIIRTYTHYIDQAGTLWFANVRGLHSYSDNKVTSYARADTLLTSRITHITQTADKTLVLATYGHGIIFFKNGKIVNRVTRQNGLPDNICKKLFVKDDVIWVATNNGVARINYKNQVGDVTFYTVSDGLISNEINDIFVDNNNIYIATPKGLSILNKALKRVPAKPPLVYISQVNTKTQTLDINKKVTLSHENNELFIRFVAITFQDPKNVVYQYRLKDDKQGWITTANNFVDFSSVSPGEHVFEVRARKLNSNWSKIEDFRFTITPPFWQKWWFIALSCALLVVSIVAIVRYLTALQYQRRFRRIETDQRLQKERERIARDLHDNVGSQLAYIINSLDDTPAAADEVLTSERTSHLREFTKQTINQLRETIWAIRQENISVGELVTKVQKLIWQLTRYRTNFDHEIKLEGNQELKLTPLQALNLYRIVQEAINNIFNHSYATHVQITFNVNSQKSLDIIIADNGVGFDTSTKAHLESYGLQNMQERAREIPAQFSITSAQGKGTRIKLKLDL
jgi:signal transduction histidine kinase